ncbi:endonuclease/exonuclease/phosphatase family protein [candidate division KSB1 bacterium]|nr:endonuclease/exonuclease/phosphatase family protein [candidate division KSB1 bacterium]RQW00708.1 MAG: endonuclease/exonuclease/phosphatase family protein [candidate division KSB1 bacterium]
MNKLLWVIIVLSCIITACNQRSKHIIRFSTFNIWELSSQKLCTIDEKGTGRDPQVLAAATIIQRIRPDILVINEIDHDYAFPEDLTKNARRFLDAYLNQGEAAITYPYIFTAPCNTGIRSGLDFNNDGKMADADDLQTRSFGEDCFGYGQYPGQYAMALLSKYRVDTTHVRTFQKFLWKDLPGNHIPPGYYSDEELAIFRLSSKSHWDVPIVIHDKTIHLFISHPTPPVFDGPEDRNGRRNFDEIKFWRHYIENDHALYDDNNSSGGFARDDSFIIAGDLNASPDASVTYDNQTAIGQLLYYPKIQDPKEFVFRRNKKDCHPTVKKAGTAQFGHGQHVRVDYLLPSRAIKVIDGGVFWPDLQVDPQGFMLAEKASDHRLVWLDIKL